MMTRTVAILSAFLVFLTLSGESLAQKRHPVDTVFSPDSLARIVIMSDHSWEYLDEDGVQDSLSVNWVETALSPFRVPLSEIPDTVILDLVDSMGVFNSPIVGKPSSRYGYRGRRRHTGVDIPLHTGTEIYAAFDGIVHKAEYYGGYGNIVILRHYNGTETYYGHLSAIHVLQGEWVTAGQVIGLGGSTGRSTGPHLHFEFRYLGYPIDPERIVEFNTGELRQDHFALAKSYFGANSRLGVDDKAKVDSIVKSTQPKTVYYKVKAGDNLSLIAKKYHTTVGQICSLNKISSKKPIKPGQTLRVK